MIIKISKIKSVNNLPPGSYGWPIAGEPFQLLRAINEGLLEKFVNDRMVKYNTDKVFKTSLLGELAYGRPC